MKETIKESIVWGPIWPPREIFVLLQLYKQKIKV